MKKDILEKKIENNQSTNKLPNKFKWKFNWKVVKSLIWIGSFLLFLLALTRFTIIGQLIDDFCFRLLFGWLKYVVFFFILIIYFDKLFKTKWLKKIFIKIRELNWKKNLWFFINVIWLISIIGVIVLMTRGDITKNNFPWYEDLWINNLIGEYWKVFRETTWWSKSSESWTFLSPVKQLNFSDAIDSAGIIGFILIGIIAYTSIFGVIILNIFSWFLLINYFVYNQPFYLFFNSTKKTEIRWKNLNHQKDYRLQTNFINEIEDQDITIEVQRAQKIHANEMIREAEKKSNNHDAKINNQNEISQLQKENQTISFTTEISRNDQEEINHSEKWNIISKEVIKKETLINEATSLNDQVEIKNDSFEEENNLKNAKIHEDGLITKSLKSFEEENKVKLKINQQQAKVTLSKLNKIFTQFQLNAEAIKYQIGSQITTYIIELDKGVKVNNLLNLKAEIALNLKTDRLRFQTPLTSEVAIGLEIPNTNKLSISLKAMLTDFEIDHHKLLINWGKNHQNKNFIFDLKSLPHLLIAGRTGGGKTLTIKNIIASLIYQHKPETLGLLLIDPKQVDFSIFQNLPHLVTPIVNDPKEAVIKLKQLLMIVEKRFQQLKFANVSHIDSYNQRPNQKEKMPYLVVIIDELADLILNYRKELEHYLTKICQKARAVGIHLIFATQRPSHDIITGLIKTNLPGRIAFQVNNYIDSKIILDYKGAENLLGMGDMLINFGNQTTLTRLQGPLITNHDLETLSKEINPLQIKPNYWSEFTNNEQLPTSFSQNDNLYDEIKQFCKKTSKELSISLLQREFKIGFNRSSRIWDQLQNDKLIIKNSITQKWIYNEQKN